MKKILSIDFDYFIDSEIFNKNVSNDELKYLNDTLRVTLKNYMKDDYYKVVLVNQTNNHEQIILKNEDEVYVKTYRSTK